MVNATMADTTTIQFIISIAPAISATLAAFAAGLSYLAIRTNIDNTKSQVLLDCLREYIEIRKHRTTAIMANSKELCSDYYRELFDLHWTEFRLWRKGYIDDETMKSWLNIRYRNYMGDSLIFKDKAGKWIKVNYKESWEKLIKEDYFEKDDLFVNFMTYNHNNEIKKALKMKKEREST